VLPLLHLQQVPVCFDYVICQKTVFKVCMPFHVPLESISRGNLSFCRDVSLRSTFCCLCEQTAEFCLSGNVCVLLGILSTRNDFCQSTLVFLLGKNYWPYAQPPSLCKSLLTASIIKVTNRLYDGGGKHLWNVGQLVWDYAALYPTATTAGQRGHSNGKLKQDNCVRESEFSSTVISV
jgi:hypothetical protein